MRDTETGQGNDDGFQEDLENAIEGGGCAEAWEAAERTRRRSDCSGGSHDRQKRKTLKGMLGSAIAGLASLAGFSSSARAGDQASSVRSGYQPSYLPTGYQDEPENEIGEISAEEAGESIRDPGRIMPLPLTDEARTIYENDDPTGQAGSGGPAAVHYPGGERVPPRGRRADARLYRTGISAVEPTLGLTDDGSIFYTATVWNQLPYPVVMRSSDGGVTWEKVYDRHKVTLDPYTYVDRATSRVFTVDYDGCSVTSFTDDGGETWATNPVVGCGYNTDHQNLFTGPPKLSETVDYPNVIYLCSIGGGAVANASTGIVCSKSLDGGKTFEPTGEPAFTFPPGATEDSADGCYGGSGHGFAARDGTVYVPRGHCGQPYVAISDDEGATWRREQVAENGMPRDESSVDHEAAVVAENAGGDLHHNIVYYFWVAEDRLPYLAVSRDGGRTWGEPMMVGHPDVTEAMLPAMALGADGGLAFAYMGSTNSPFQEDGLQTDYEGVTWNGYMGVTGDATADRPRIHTTPINDPDDPLIRGACGPFRCQAEYDFIDVQIGPSGEAWSVFVDGCEGETCYDIGEGIVGRVVGGPELGCSRYPSC